MICAICQEPVKHDHPEVPLCGQHVTQFIDSLEFDAMFTANGHRLGGPFESVLRLRYRTLFVERVLEKNATTRAFR